MSIDERRESSSEFLIAQITKTFFGRQAFPSLFLCRISLKMAKNGEIPIPPATKTRFSYLQSKIRALFVLKQISNIQSKFITHYARWYGDSWP